jgi:hypothetical protein
VPVGRKLAANAGVAAIAAISALANKHFRVCQRLAGRIGLCRCTGAMLVG